MSALEVLIGLFGVNERRLSLKPTQFSQTIFSFAPDKRTKDIPGLEGGQIRWAEVTHTRGHFQACKCK